MINQFGKALFIFALIAGYAYVSNQDYQDAMLAQQSYNK